MPISHVKVWLADFRWCANSLPQPERGRVRETDAKELVPWGNVQQSDEDHDFAVRVRWSILSNRGVRISGFQSAKCVSKSVVPSSKQCPLSAHFGLYPQNPRRRSITQNPCIYYVI